MTPGFRGFACVTHLQDFNLLELRGERSPTAVRNMDRSTIIIIRSILEQIFFRYFGNSPGINVIVRLRGPTQVDRLEALILSVFMRL